MHRTWGSSLVTLQQLPQRRSAPAATPNGIQRPTTPPAINSLKIFVNPFNNASLSSNYSNFFTRTGHTSSTIWGPGALTGKLMKHLGEKVEGAAEYLFIRTKLSQIEKMQRILLGSVRELSHEETQEITDQCEKLVDLCIPGTGYPVEFMIKAFRIILSGFKQPGCETWTYHIAEAISRRRKIDIYEIFHDCFFFLLDESIFRIEGALNLQTLSFRCPAVAHEIAVIISHLVRKDYVPRIVLEPSDPFILLAGARSDDNDKASFSAIIIRAGLFRLTTHWIDHGLPHWDARGKARLEEALQDVANAQIYCGDVEKHSEEAMDLKRKLHAGRLLDEVPEEIPRLHPGLDASSQFTINEVE